MLSLEDINDIELVTSVDIQRTLELCFSPKSTLLATWEPLRGLCIVVLLSVLFLTKKTLCWPLGTSVGSALCLGRQL